MIITQPYLENNIQILINEYDIIFSTIEKSQYKVTFYNQYDMLLSIMNKYLEILDFYYNNALYFVEKNTHEDFDKINFNLDISHLNFQKNYIFNILNSLSVCNEFNIYNSLYDCINSFYMITLKTIDIVNDLYIRSVNVKIKKSF